MNDSPAGHSGMPAQPTWSDSVMAFAVHVCREVYMLTGGNPTRWQAVHQLESRLKVDKRATQTALQCAAHFRWLETVGNPVFSVRLLDAGRAMFAKENPKLAKPRGGPRS